MAWADWIQRACIFLVISCPCALVISVPLGFFGGIGASSKIGILVKGSNYLEAVAEMTTIVFDKTGTLTKGEFKVSEVQPSADKNNTIGKEELLEIAAVRRGLFQPSDRELYPRSIWKNTFHGARHRYGGDRRTRNPYIY